MCLTTDNPTVKVAKKNIIVFKGGYYGVDSLRTDLKHYTYYKMENNPNVPLVPVAEKKYTCGHYHPVETGYHIVNRGYHSYNRFHHALFIIPKGTEYIDGWYNDSKSTPNRVSSNIVYIGCAWNPLTWLKAFSFKYPK